MFHHLQEGEAATQLADILKATLHKKKKKKPL